MPDWLDDVPAWEQREVIDHFDAKTNQLDSSFLPDPISFEEAIKRRSSGEPLEYILRHCHIDQITLKTDSRALIPRPETETMVRRFAEGLDKLPPGPIVDCGTGSGFMAIWLVTHTQRAVVATDRFAEPLTLARENRQDLGGTFSLVRADRLTAFDSFAGAVINLPYVDPDSDRLFPSVRDNEPDEALYPTDNILVFYMELLNQIEQKLSSGGEVWIEGDQKIFQRLRTAGAFEHLSLQSSILKDNYGQFRFLLLQAP